MKCHHFRILLLLVVELRIKFNYGLSFDEWFSVWLLYFSIFIINCSNFSKLSLFQTYYWFQKFKYSNWIIDMCNKRHCKFYVHCIYINVLSEKNLHIRRINLYDWLNLNLQTNGIISKLMNSIKKKLVMKWNKTNGINFES